jgi:hypothetical protein
MSNQRIPLLGRLAVHNKMISMDQLAEATGEQGRRNDGSNIGKILIEKGFLTTAQLEKLVKGQQQLIARQRASQAAKAAAPGLETEPPKRKVAIDPRSEPMTPPAAAPPVAAPTPAPQPKPKASAAAPSPAAAAFASFHEV